MRENSFKNKFQLLPNFQISPYQKLMAPSSRPKGATEAAGRLAMCHAPSDRTLSKCNRQLLSTCCCCIGPQTMHHRNHNRYHRLPCPIQWRWIHCRCSSLSMKAPPTMSCFRIVELSSQRLRRHHGVVLRDMQGQSIGFHLGFRNRRLTRARVQLNVENY